VDAKSETVKELPSDRKPFDLTPHESELPFDL
jgi:hypothetical protein